MTKISKALYRAIVRWAKQNSDVPFQLRLSDVRQAVGPSLHFQDMDLTDSGSVVELARRCFRQNIHVNEQICLQEYERSIERGFYALRALNTNYAALLETMREIRRDRINRQNIKFSVGTVFRHAKYGYSGVVYGWDRTCNRDEEWVRTMNVNPDQAFYYVLPDENDCTRLFGGIRLTKYVGEDNIIPLADNERVVHRALDNYMVGYSPALKRYVPNQQLQFQYPDVYVPEEGGGESELLPASEDSNLLIHEEPEIGKSQSAAAY